MQNITGSGLYLPNCVNPFQMDKAFPRLIPVLLHLVSGYAFINGMKVTVFLTPVHALLPCLPGFPLQPLVFFISRVPFLIAGIVIHLYIVDNRLWMTATVCLFILIGFMVEMFQMAVYICRNLTLTDT